MRVLITQNAGATDYWRFPWLRYRDQYALEMRPPVFGKALLQTNPDLKIQFVRPLAESLIPDVYYPLEDEPGISRRFASLRDPDAVLAFANAYGLLGFEEVPRLQAYREELDDNGERVGEWLMEAQQLRRLFEVWDLIQAGNKRELRRIIQWSPHGVSAMFPEVTPGYVIADGVRNADWIDRWKRGDVFGPAKPDRRVVLPGRGTRTTGADLELVWDCRPVRRQRG